jgi:hypothetical protein
MRLTALVAFAEPVRAKPDTSSFSTLTAALKVTVRRSGSALVMTAFEGAATAVVGVFAAGDADPEQAARSRAALKRSAAQPKKRCASAKRC